MKVYTDATETSFFKTDNHVKNLHEIEINTIEDFVFKYALESDILLDMKCWMVKRFDELLPGNPTADESNLHGEWVEIDFVANMSYLDILAEIAKYENISNSMDDYKNSGIFKSVEHEWINDGNNEKWTITAQNDSRKLEITIDAEDNVTTRLV